MVQITDIRASPERDGCSSRVLFVSHFPLVHSDRDLQFRISVWDMGHVLLHGHICEFRNDNFECQEPTISAHLAMD